jgi:NitT/TauT family transport system substrate-binding protein
VRVLSAADGMPSAAVVNSASYQKYQDLTGIYVKGDSRLRTVKDLEGQTVAVIARGSALEIVPSWSLQRAGGDPSKVKWIVLDLPTSLAELDSGKIAAAALTPPFSNAALAHGDRLLVGDDAEFFGPGNPVGLWLTTSSKLGSERSALLDFRAAVKETNHYAATHLSQFEALAAQLTQIPVAQVSFDPDVYVFPTDVTEADLANVAAKMVSVGALAKVPNLSGVIVP